MRPIDRAHRPVRPFLLAAASTLAVFGAGCHAPGPRAASVAGVHAVRADPSAAMFPAGHHEVVVHAAPGVPSVWPGDGVESTRPLDLTPPEPGDRVWSLVSEPLTPDAPFHEALASINARLSPGGVLALEIRVVGAGENWSDWLRVLTWGDGDAETLGPPVRTIAGPGGVAMGVIDVDFFRSSLTFERVQYRVRAVAGAEADASRPPATIDRIAITTTAPRVRWTPLTAAASAPVRLDVPFRSQKTPDPTLSGRLCSPTSVAMVVAASAPDAAPSVYQVAERALDREFNLYGNWPRNVQAGFSYGVPGIVARLAGWDQVQTLLREGRVIVASIRVERPGQLAGAPYQTTGGHLIVLTGITETGDVLVNDPAVGDETAGRLVYFRADMTRVWLTATSGTCYIFLPAPARAEASAP
jgi:hypothetical protein